MKRFTTLIWQHGMIALLCVSMIACAPVDVVLSDIDLVLQTAASLEVAIGTISPADAAALSLLTGVAIAGVDAIKTAYDTYEKNKTASNLQNIVAAAQAIQANLPQELAALHIVDPNAVAKATAWVNLVVGTAAAIVTAVTGAASSTAHSRAFTIIVTPEDLQARWQHEVCNDDASCGALVRVHYKHASRKFLP